jgi:hypothetical protein
MTVQMPATRVYSTRERDWRDNSRSTQALPIPASPSIIENEGTTSGWTPWGTYQSGGFGETARLGKGPVSYGTVVGGLGIP